MQRPKPWSCWDSHSILGKNGSSSVNMREHQMVQIYWIIVFHIVSGTCHGLIAPKLHWCTCKYPSGLVRLLDPGRGKPSSPGEQDGDVFAPHKIGSLSLTCLESTFTIAAFQLWFNSKSRNRFSFALWLSLQTCFSQNCVICIFNEGTLFFWVHFMLREGARPAKVNMPPSALTSF